MMNINDAIVDARANEMLTEIDVFHAGVRVRVMCASDSTLVVAVKSSWLSLREPELVKE
jgi:hypothetical protein